jgi:arylsulfatase A-like enzyme
VASILTGLYPHRHGLYRMGRKLPAAAVTLAEILNDAGFATAAVVSHNLISKQFGFDRGFETFLDDEAIGHNHVSSPGVTRQATGLLEEFAEGRRPFFLFVHYFDPHYTYVRHPEFGFAAERAGRLVGGEKIHELRRMELTKEELQLVRDIYDEEIRFTDAAVGELIGALRAYGLLDETVVVFTADHGEELFDRGWLGHTRSLHEEVVRAPLLIRLPDRDGEVAHRGRRVETPVSLVALAPTLLELLSVTPPASVTFQHRSLTPLFTGDAITEPDLVYAEVDFMPAGQKKKPRPTRARARAVIDGSSKLIHDELADAYHFYDLARDPFELHDLASSETARVASLRERLDAFRTESAPSADEVSLSEGELAELRALGYAELAEEDELGP